MDLCGFFIWGDIPTTHLSFRWVSKVSRCLQKWEHIIWAVSLLIQPQQEASVTSVSYTKHIDVDSWHKHLSSAELVMLFTLHLPCPPGAHFPMLFKNHWWLARVGKLLNLFQQCISFVITISSPLLVCLLICKVIKGNQQTKRKITPLIFWSAAVSCSPIQLSGFKYQKFSWRIQIKNEQPLCGVH